MLIKTFLDRAISDIRAGIDEFNDSECQTEALMPSEIEFELKVMKVRWDNQDFVIMHDPNEQSEIQTIKFKINMVEYPGDKDQNK